MWLVVVCDQETSKTRRLKAATGLCKIHPQWVVTPEKKTEFSTTNQHVTQSYTSLSCKATRGRLHNLVLLIALTFA
jgi:hypothetical protein